MASGGRRRMFMEIIMGLAVMAVLLLIPIVVTTEKEEAYAQPGITSPGISSGGGISPPPSTGTTGEEGGAISAPTTTTTTGGGGEVGVTFTDLENYGHSTGFSIYEPGGNWVIDSFSDGDGRMQTEQFAAVPAISPEFEVAAAICEDIAATPGGLSSVSPTTGKTYYCGAFGSHGTNLVEVRMYQTFGANPLEYHLSLLDYNTFYNANKRVVNITDTTVPLVDSTTNQTIQEIPAKIANIILLRNDPSSIKLFDYIDTVLYTTDTEIADGYSYVITFKRDMPGQFDSGDSKASIAATDAIAKVIFDSFRILSK